MEVFHLFIISQLLLGHSWNSNAFLTEELANSLDGLVDNISAFTKLAGKSVDVQKLICRPPYESSEHKNEPTVWFLQQIQKSYHSSKPTIKKTTDPIPVQN